MYLGFTLVVIWFWLRHLCSSADTNSLALSSEQCLGFQPSEPISAEALKTCSVCRDCFCLYRHRKQSKPSAHWPMRDIPLALRLSQSVDILPQPHVALRDKVNAILISRFPIFICVAFHNLNIWVVKIQTSLFTQQRLFPFLHLNAARPKLSPTH